MVANVKERQTVLLVHNFYQIPGGEDTVFANEKAMLEAHGHKVLTYTRNNCELNSMNLFRKLLFPLTQIFNLRTYFDIRKLIRENGIQVVHVHNTLALISPAVFYAAKHSGVKVVQTLHNFRMICPNAVLHRNGGTCHLCLEKGLGCAVKNHCYRGSALQTLGLVISMQFHRMTGIYRYPYYICLTEFHREMLMNYGRLRRQQVFVKPNVVSRNWDQAAGDQAAGDQAAGDQDKITVAPRKNQIIYVGRLEESKGITEILRAFEHLKAETDPKLIVCGSGALETWCRQYCAAHHLNVEILGQTPNEAVMKLMAESRAVVFASKLYEGCPMSILEAYSVNTPVICADFGNGGSLVTEGITGWKYVPGSIESICCAVRQAVQNGQDLTSSVRREFQAKYSETANYNMLAEIYNA